MRLSVKRDPVTVIAGLRIRVATTFWARLRGLLGTRPDALSRRRVDGMLFPHCRAVHTWGMRYPLDLVFLDDTGAVLQVRRAVAPGRLVAGPAGTYAVLELPSAGDKERT